MYSKLKIFLQSHCYINIIFIIRQLLLLNKLQSTPIKNISLVEITLLLVQISFVKRLQSFILMQIFFRLFQIFFQLLQIFFQLLQITFIL